LSILYDRDEHLFWLHEVWGEMVDIRSFLTYLSDKAKVQLFEVPEAAVDQLG
jgi:hypothetical protein